jgi:hypothetical protein
VYHRRQRILESNAEELENFVIEMIDAGRERIGEGNSRRLRRKGRKISHLLKKKRRE